MVVVVGGGVLAPVGVVGAALVDSGLVDAAANGLVAPHHVVEGGLPVVVVAGPGAGEAGVVGVVGQSMGETITIASDASREGGESGGGSGRVGGEVVIGGGGIVSSASASSASSSIPSPSPMAKTKN